MELTDGRVALAAAEAGADVVRRYFRTPVAHHAKEGTDFATDADLESEETIRAVLSRLRPGDAQLGEEGGASGPDSPRRWLIDPLCGTRNFAAGIPLVATNVALSVDGAVVAGASADPVLGETYWFDDGGARMRRGDEDTVLTPTVESMMVDVNLDGSRERLLRALGLLGDARVSERFQIRVVSSTLGLAWVAAGRYAAYLTEGDLRDNVHFAAGIGLCRAAGCPVTDLDGHPVDTGQVDRPGRRRGLLASADEDTHAALLDVARDVLSV
ncbi:MAG: inositol monophosphatase [Nocardioides sp.]|nr:inositol monophosphatase [Nocardioides sp.]